MKIDIPLQIAIAQCWLVSHIMCYPFFNDRAENRDSNKVLDIKLKPRALTTSFMPGFGKRQSAQLQNEARSRAEHKSALEKYGSDINGRIRDGLYALFDTSNSADFMDETKNDGDNFVLDKETLKKLINDYYGRTEENREQEVSQGWYTHGNPNRLLDSVLKLRAMERQNYLNGNQAWREDRLQSDDLKI